MEYKNITKLEKLFYTLDNNNLSNHKVELINYFLASIYCCYSNILKNEFVEILKNNKDYNELSIEIYNFFILNSINKVWEKLKPLRLNKKIINCLIDCSNINWFEINPDIFGSMIQAVIHTEYRRKMGIHYTSVTNIMKVIDPLFLNELKNEFEKYYDNKNKLYQLLERLERIRIFDPACGSGNFLIIAYKELRKLEIDIFQRINELSQTPQLPLSRIKLSQFYGIELDYFAYEVAILSLWLAEHQMNIRFKEDFSQVNPSLLLKDGGNITHGNATRLQWEEICPQNKNTEIYILGNPPYLGSSNQDKSQKADMDFVFKGIKNYKKLDYITCWVYKAAVYIAGHKAQFGFISTNSICQGEQVALLWSHIFNQNLEIGFAHTSFKWSNNAKANAGVSCCIIGIRNISSKPKYLYQNDKVIEADNIGPYLTDGSNLIIQKRSTPLSNLPKMIIGSMPVEGGFLILLKNEVDALLNQAPHAQKFIKPLVGSQEFIRGEQRWCLWIEDENLAEAQSIPFINHRINQVREFRLKSAKKPTVEAAQVPHKFAEIRFNHSAALIIPRVASSRREYMPIGFLNPDTIITDRAQAIYNAEPYIFGLIASKMHIIWVRATAGYLKTDYNYSSLLCYNNFPIPDLTEKQKATISQHALNVLSEREKHCDQTIAQLYDPDKMPDGLRTAHHHLDIAVEQCYRSQPFSSDAERLKYLFKLYSQKRRVNL